MECGGGGAVNWHPAHDASGDAGGVAQGSYPGVTGAVIRDSGRFSARGGNSTWDPEVVPLEGFTVSH